MNKYSLKIWWSDEDDSYVAIVPEMPGLSAFGETWEEAIEDAKSILKDMLQIIWEDRRYYGNR